MTTTLDSIAAAERALATHDALREAGKAEPRLDDEGMPFDPDAWLTWHASTYKPAFAAWREAMDELAAVLGHDVGRHPTTFRPVCEEIIRDA